MNDLQKWLKRNATTFKLNNYSSSEIAWFAMLNGFDLQESCGGVSDHLTHLKRLLTFWESPLNEQWLDLTAYQRRGDDYGQA